MNRLATQPISFDQQATSSTNPVSLPLDAAHCAGSTLHWTDSAPSCRPAVFCPLHYESGYAYPLVVWLHGENEDEGELRRVLPRISLRNYVGVAPRGTVIGECRSSKANCGWSQSASNVEQAGEIVFDAVRYVQSTLNISPHRVFLAGRDSGGTMALRLVFEHPQAFAGAVSLGGLLPRIGQPLRNLNELRKKPLLLAAHVGSQLTDEQGICRDLRLLHAAGMSMSLRQYAGEGSLLPLMLADVDRWLMAVICPSTNGNVH